MAITNDCWNWAIYNQLRFGIDFVKDYKKLVEKVTAADIQAVAKDMLDSHRRIEVTMLSK